MNCVKNHVNNKDIRVSQFVGKKKESIPALADSDFCGHLKNSP